VQKVMHNGETEVKVIHSVLFVCWLISIDYKAVDKCCLQNPIEKSIPIASGYELCNKIGLILVSYIHSHLVLVVGINNNRYIKLFLAFSKKTCGICSTCIGSLVAWMLSHFQYQRILTTSRVDCRHHGNRRNVHPEQGCNPVINSSISNTIWQFGILPNL
jgi:hypothetical protein